MPQLRQWCRLRPIQNGTAHFMQTGAAWSGTQSVVEPKGTWNNSHNLFLKLTKREIPAAHVWQDFTLSSISFSLTVSHDDIEALANAVGSSLRAIWDGEVGGLHPFPPKLVSSFEWVDLRPEFRLELQVWHTCRHNATRVSCRSRRKASISIYKYF